jgi:hypothetical protein
VLGNILRISSVHRRQLQGPLPIEANFADNRYLFGLRLLYIDIIRASRWINLVDSLLTARFKYLVAVSNPSRLARQLPPSETS